MGTLYDAQSSKIPVHILLDTACSANVIDQALVTRHSLPTQRLRQPLSVTLASGVAHSASLSEVIQLRIAIQEYSAVLAFVVMPQVADVTLGVPWFEDHQAIINHGTHELRFEYQEQWFSTSIYPIGRQVMASSHMSHIPPCILKYSCVFEPPSGLPPQRSINCDIQLVPGASPSSQKARRCGPKDRTKIRQEVDKLLKLGFIEYSQSAWASPAFIVHEPNRKDRLVFDFKCLNAVTIPNRFPIPHTDDLIAQFGGKSIFSVIDLKSAYHQVLVNPDHCHLTAFITHEGLYQWRVMPFGLCNAPSIMQRLTSDLLRRYDLRDHAAVYLDDIIVGTCTHEEHESILERLFAALAKEDYRIAPEKCHFFQEEVQFLGSRLSKHGLQPVQVKLDAIQAWPVPANTKHVRQFLGLCNYYRQYIANFAALAAPLNQLTSSKVIFQWTAQHQSAFEGLKQLLSKPPILRLPIPDQPFYINTDASLIAVGAVLQQYHTDALFPISYMSVSLNQAQRNYSTFDREWLAIMAALDKWKPLIFGEKVVIRTDHRPLVHKFQQSIAVSQSSRHVRWMCELLEWGPELSIEYQKGETNIVADGLSRRPDHELVVAAVHLEGPPSVCPWSSLAIYQEHHPADINRVLFKRHLREESIPFVYAAVQLTLAGDTWISQVQAAYASDAIAQALLHSKSTTLPIPKELVVRDGVIYHWPLAQRDDGPPSCLYVPDMLRGKLLQYYHNNEHQGAHMGIDKCYQKLKIKYYWPGMYNQLRRYISACPVCACSKHSRQAPAGLLQSLEIPNRRFGIIHMDFVGPFRRTSLGSNGILVVVDRLTKFAVFIPCDVHVGGPETLELLRHHFFNLFGHPDVIITDRGSAFTGQFFRAYMKTVGIEHRLATVEHPQTNGQVENVNGTIKQMLRSYLLEHRSQDWHLALPTLQMAYNSSVQASTGCSPNRLVFGEDWHMPDFLNKPTSSSSLMTTDHKISYLVDFAKNHLSKAQAKQAKYYNQHHRPLSFNIGDLVFVKISDAKVQKNGSLAPKYEGPFSIIDRIGDTAYKLDIPHRKSNQTAYYHVSKLKKHVQSQDFVEPTVTSSLEPLVVEEIVDVKEDEYGTPHYLVKFQHKELDKVHDWRPVTSFTEADWHKIFVFHNFWPPQSRHPSFPQYYYNV